MTFEMANNSRFSFHHLSIALCFILINSAVSMGQEDPATEIPPWACDDGGWTSYNIAVGIDVLINDLPGSDPIDSSTLTIVSQPSSGTADIDPVLGVVVYTPDVNFAGYDQFQYQVADTAGNYSNVATVEVWVYNDPPYISFSYYRYSGNLWVFYGDVWDENPGICTVTFGGILDGETAGVTPSGQFELYVEIETGVTGLVTAQTTDEIGEVSNVAQDYFFQF